MRACSILVFEDVANRSAGELESRLDETLLQVHAGDALVEARLHDQVRSGRDLVRFSRKRGRLLTLGPGETVAGVSVVDMSGAIRTLASTDYAYDASAGVLRLGAGVLAKSDATLRVTLASPSCTPDAGPPPAR